LTIIEITGAAIAAGAYLHWAVRPRLICYRLGRQLARLRYPK
jgi:hypothetical protein